MVELHRQLIPPYDENAILRSIVEATPLLREPLVGLSPAAVFAILGQLTAETINGLPVKERQGALETWVEAVRATVRLTETGR